MKRIVQLASILAACLPSVMAHGHGTPIGVSVPDRQLIISNGVLDNGGFAQRIFVEQGVDGFPDVTPSLSGFGPALYWTVPGFEITGMAENSGLFLETLARPVKDSVPSKERVLWYWNSTAKLIEDAPPDNHFTIRKSGSQNIFLSGTDSLAPAALKIAAPLASDMNFHNHSLALYALHNAVTPPDGVYGFFARLVSFEYAPSDPFLVVFNNGFLDSSQMIEGAVAINAAAAEPSRLTGDYNDDGVVNAADYVVWRHTYNSGTILNADGSGNHFIDDDDYDVWRWNFGKTLEGAGASESVPEPGSAVLAALSAMAALMVRRPTSAAGMGRKTWDRSVTESSCYHRT